MPIGMIPQDHYPGQVGTGVLIDEINRITDKFTQFQLEIESRDLGKFTVKRQIFQELENIFKDAFNH